MNKTERKALLKLLLDGDLLAAITYVECAGSPIPAKSDETLKPIPREIPTWVKGWTVVGENGKTRVDRPTVSDATARAIFNRERPAALEVAACGCTLYIDTAYQCDLCIKLQSPDACRVLIAQHGPELRAYDAKMGFQSQCWNGRDFMINPHNGYYGKRDGMVMTPKKK